MSSDTPAQPHGNDPSDKGTWNPDVDPSVPDLTEEEVRSLLGHCSAPRMMEFPSALKQIEHAGTLEYKEDESLRARDSEGNPVYSFEYAEHAWLGDTLTLKWHDGKDYLARDKKFTLPNGVEVTYRQINALGGDFYGSEQPICEGSGPDQQKSRFLEGYGTLAINGGLTPTEVQGLIKLKQDEVNLINAAAPQGKDPSEVYRTQVPSTRDNVIAGLEGYFLRNQKGYIGLAFINFDHFGQGAHTAYNAGHTAALQKAAEGKTPANLEAAYAMNAFADHFLEDSFAAGHIRTPRKALHGTVNAFRDICAMYMHEEDNALGLQVENPEGKKWTAYGDSKLLDAVDKDNLARCHDALMASTKEVFDAWNSGQVPSADSFGAWRHAPIIQTAFSEKNHAPLFNGDGYPRKDINNRWDRSYKGWWGFTYPSLWVQLKTSPKFKEPITP